MHPRVFIDLDGVMADFETHFANRFGKVPPSKAGHPNSVDDDEMWALIHGSGDFFLTMPLFPLARAFLRDIRQMGIEPAILTAASKQHFNVMAAQKMQWVREQLCSHIMVIPTYGSAHKQFYIQNPGDILIDDFTKNCDRWTNAGGIAIHHTTFVDSVVKLYNLLGSGNNRPLITGQKVRKKSGSYWEGEVVGHYSTKQTPRGVCVQLPTPEENGPVQLYPESAFEIK